MRKGRRIKSSNWIIFLCAFLFSVFMTALIYYRQGIYLGSKKTILLYDMYQQYCAFYASLKNLFLRGNSFSFNWSTALGGGYLGVFFYYLASPLNLLFLLSDVHSLPDWIYLLTILKFGLCGLSFSVYLSSSPRYKQSEKKVPVWGILLFSILYALSSYNLMYSMSLMWLDGVILLPFVMLGIDQIITRGKMGIYVATVVMVIFCNYYTAYMIVLFGGFYFLLNAFVAREKTDLAYISIGKQLKGYILGNFFAIGLAAPFLSIIVKDLQNGKGMETENAIENGFFLHNVFDVLKQVFAGQYDTIIDGGLPSLFCGTGALIFFVIFLLCGDYSVYKKVVPCVLLLLLLFSYIILPLDQMWHGFRNPVCFPHRYAFLWSFVLLSYGIEGTRFVHNKDFSLKSFIVVSFCVFEMIELFINGNIVIAEHSINLKYTIRMKYEDEVSSMEEDLKYIDKIEEDLWYRVEKDYNLTDNDGLLMNYPGLNFFSSSYNNSFLTFCKNLGLSQSSYKCREEGYTLLTDTLFGIKYKVNKNIYPNDYFLLSSINGTDICLNPYYGGIAFVGNGNLESELQYEQDLFNLNPFQFQNDIATALTGDSLEVFQEANVEVQQTNKEYASSFLVDVRNDGPLYMYISFSKEERNILSHRTYYKNQKLVDSVVRIIVNDQVLYSFDLLASPYNMYLGDFKKGDKVQVVVEGIANPRDYRFASFSTSAFSVFCDKIYKDEIDLCINSDYDKLDWISKDIISGKINLDTEGYLVFAIPFDDSYRIFVDDEEVETYAVLGALLGAVVESGVHTVRITYQPKGLISGVALLIFIFIIICFYWGTRRKK